MTIENRRWSPQPPPLYTLNATAKSYQPQDIADSLLDRVYSPLAASIWNDRPTTTIPSSTRTHSRFSHSTDGDGQDEGTGDAEVVAMLKLSTNLHSLVVTQDEDDVEPDLASSKLLLRAPSPGSTAIFSADLERVNTWFKDELQDDTQRLMVLFSLVQLMPEWQQDFLLQLLEQKRKSGRMQEGMTTAKTVITKPPPGLDSKPPSPIGQRLGVHTGIVKPSSAPPRVPSGPLSWRRNKDSASPIEEAPSQMVLASPAPRRASILIQQDDCDAFPGHYHQYASHVSQFRSVPLTPTQPVPQQQQQDDTYANLFWSDLHSWLRCLRLHKYEHIFQKVNRQVFLDWSAVDLENAGVVAMGARNKFLRLFEQIKEQQQVGR